jgi:hypothetical protein
MPKMKDRNQQLKSSLTSLSSKETIEEIKSIPKEDTVNRQGFKAYSLPEELRLLTMLNTLKLQPQYYRTEGETMRELRDLIEHLDPYFVAQAIVYSRCMAEGMRSINHLAAAILAPLTKGLDWGKRFYGPYDKRLGKNGCIFRPDDMSEIKDVIYALTPNQDKPSLPSTVRNGFKAAIESFDTYRLSKYKKSIIDVSNLVHPNPTKSKATFVDANGETQSTLNALMQGLTVSADTWEVAQSEAGQEVAKAVKEGKLTKEEGEKVLAEAKADNWESLLKDGRLPIIAALRNIRNIMMNPRQEIIDLWCKLIQNQELIVKNLVLPIYFDLAYDVVDTEFNNIDGANQVKQALQDAYIKSIPNLASIFTGKTCIMIDCSASMGSFYVCDGKTGRGRISYWDRNNRCGPQSCAYKAGLIAATIAKACDADVIKFGSSAHRFNFNKHENVFSLAKKLGTADDGATYPNYAWELITREKAKYDRVIFISDNEVNSYKLTSDAYKNYLRICSPYIYAVDLAAYGTTPLAGNKIAYFYGYGKSLYEDMTKNEFNPSAIIDKVKQIVI